MIVSQATAQADPTAHSFRPGTGYVYLGQPSLPQHAQPRQMVLPANLVDGSIHWLTQPGSASDRMFVWLAAHRAWRPYGGVAGNRMAHTADYLASVGWTYSRKAD